MTAGSAGERSVPARMLLASIAAYKRYLSPLLPPFCRFRPTCSAYAAGAIERYGARRGGALAVSRIVRCTPFSAGGDDPVPAPQER